MKNEIEVTHNFDTVAFTIVSCNGKSFTVWPGPDYLKDLEDAMQACKSRGLLQ